PTRRASDLAGRAGAGRSSAAGRCGASAAGADGALGAGFGAAGAAFAASAGLAAWASAGVVFFSAAFFSAAFLAAGGGFSRILRTTGGSMVDDADLTDARCAFGWAKKALYQPPSTEPRSTALAVAPGRAPC